MFEQYVQQLQDANPEIRRKAIIVLGNSGDTRCLAPLGEVYKTDPDPALRELALKAGRYIKTKSTQFPTPTEPPPPAPRHTPPPFTVTPPEILQIVETAPQQLTPIAGVTITAQTSSITTKQPTERERALAKTRLDSAIGYLSTAQSDKAMTDLIAAVRYDPSILTNSLARNLAVSLTGISNVEEALNHIRNRAEFPNPGKGNIAIPGKRPRESASFKLDSEMLESLLMVVILFVVLCFGYLFIQQAFAVVMPKLTPLFMQQKDLKDPDVIAEWNDMQQELRQINTKQILTGGFLGTANTLASIGLLYIVGVLLGGAGDLFKFFNSLIRIQLVQWVLVVCLLGLPAFAVLRQMPLERVLIFSGISFALVGLVLAIMYFWMVYAVGKGHEVSFWKGFFIVLVTTVAANVIANLLDAVNTASSIIGG